MEMQVVGKSLPYGGHRYQVGDRIEIRPRDAKVLLALGRVQSLAPPRPDIPASPSLPLAVVATTAAASNGGDQGNPDEGVSVAERDTADQSEQSTVQQDEKEKPPAFKDSTPKKRRYKRRDHTSE